MCSLKDSVFIGYCIRSSNNEFLIKLKKNSLGVFKYWSFLPDKAIIYKSKGTALKVLSSFSNSESLKISEIYENCNNYIVFD